MPATIFAGSKIKALKDRISLNDITEIVSVDFDPKINGLSAPIGSIALNSVFGNVYKKIGTENTDWAELETNIPIFGTGADGNVTISSGTTTLTRDMFYENLTISGTGALKTNGYRVFVKDTLTLTNAPANAIHFNGNAGGSNPDRTLGGSAGAAVVSGTVAGSQGGSAGGDANATSGAQAAAIAALTTSNGGAAGSSGAGGADLNREYPGGAARAATALPGLTATYFFVTEHLLRGAQLIEGGAGAPGGGGGVNGNGSSGGGGGGAGGGVLALFAKKINRGSSTAAGAISANGGNGGSALMTAVPFPARPDNGSGGGGGGGGGGGFIYLVYQELLGSEKSGGIRANGGTGGNGADRLSYASGLIAGNGGDGGGGGRIVKIDISNGTSSEVIGGAGSAATPRQDSETGGVGGAGGTATANL